MRCPSRVISGNDGGIHLSSDGGSSWTKSPDLPISQFYAITVDPQQPQRIYGGTQDNSTLRTLTGALDDWDILIGGDGFTVVVDPTSSNTIYGEWQYDLPRRCLVRLLSLDGTPLPGAKVSIWQAHSNRIDEEGHVASDLVADGNGRCAAGTRRLS